MSAQTLFAITKQEITWRDGISDGRIAASGERSDLSELFLQLSSAE